jgi:hypothetical protein
MALFMYKDESLDIHDAKRLQETYEVCFDLSSFC